MSKVEKKKSNFKILVIDDSPLSTNSISEILSSEGYSAVDTSNTPSEGLQKLNLDDYHLCILDVVMPKISGIELAKEISEGNSGACILMISSLDSENVLIESIASGAKDFLLKPFTESQLTTTVNKLYDYAIKEKIF